MKKIVAALQFFFGFLKNPISVSSIAPSSSRLSTKIVEVANVSNSNVIIELGCGIGSITEQIAFHARSGSKIISFDTDKNFVEITKKRVPDVNVVNATALNLKYILNEYEISGCDSIVSAIPWASIDKKEQDRMIEVIYNSMNCGGYFATLGYITGLMSSNSSYFRSKLKEKFSDYGETRVVWSNIPPSIIIWARK